MSIGIAEGANLLLLAGLVVYGLVLFADYWARGRWAKNATSLLASMGMLTLSAALAMTPANVAIWTRLAQSDAPKVLLGLSSFLLLMAMGTFGLITYSRPLRLRHEKRIKRELDDGLPKIL